jgi:TRAP-type C4-dicarboxylate transport system permease small subunit
MTDAEPASAPARRGLSGALIYRVAAAAALFGGALLSAIALMSVASIAPRSLGMQPIEGDFELVQVGLAVCITLLLPWCELQGGNITVDFFTARMRVRFQRRLDAIGSMLFAVMIALVTWRTGAGAAAMKAARETTMLLGFPLWIAYAAMTPGLALTSLAAVYRSVRAWSEARGD